MTLTSKIPLPKVFCLIGPSGTGKNAIASSIPLPEIISYRTREMRDGEKEGINGYFISKEKFLEMKEKGLWIAETDYAGNYYGITQGEILDLEEKPMLYVIDWEGILRLKNSFDKLDGYSSDEIVSIFIYTPREHLEARMLKQGRKRDEIKVRLDRADRDYAVSSRCDYIVENANGEFDRTISDIMKIILKESF